MARYGCLNDFVAVKPDAKPTETESGLARATLPAGEADIETGTVIDVSKEAAKKALDLSGHAIEEGTRVAYRRFQANGIKDDPADPEPSALFVELRDIAAVIVE